MKSGPECPTIFSRENANQVADSVPVDPQRDTPAMSSKKLLLAVVVAIGLIGLIVLRVMTRDSRDWAELNLISVKAEQSGQIYADFETRHSNGAGIRDIHLDGGVEHVGGEIRGSGFPFTTQTGSIGIAFNLNPEQLKISGEFSNSVLFARLLLHVGETRRIYAGEELVLCDFTAAGKHYRWAFAVIPSEEPWEDPRTLLRRHQSPAN